MKDAIIKGIKFLSEKNVDVPEDIWRKALKSGLFKAGGEWAGITATYHDAITQSIIDYFEGAGVAASRNNFKRACIQAFGDSFDMGWVDGGGELPIDDDAMGWIEARMQTEFGFIEELFQQAKQLRKDKEFDFFEWATARADGYVQTLTLIYNQALLMAAKNIMLTFEGDDGAESCTDCQKYKGKRHKASWWIARNAIPPNRDFECHGYHCQHYLVDDNGEQWTSI